MQAGSTPLSSMHGTSSSSSVMRTEEHEEGADVKDDHRLGQAADGDRGGMGPALGRDGAPSTCRMEARAWPLPLP